MTTNYIKVEKVAQIFDVSQYTVRGWLKTGKLKGAKSPGGQWRVTQDELERFAQEHFGEGAANVS